MQHSSRAELILFLPFLALHARSPRHNGAGSAIAQRDTGSRNKALAARVRLDPLRAAAPPTAKASSVPGGQRRSRPLPCGARPEHGPRQRRAAPAPGPDLPRREGTTPSQKNFPPRPPGCDAAPRPPPSAVGRTCPLSLVPCPLPLPRPAPRPGGPGCPPCWQGGCGAGPPEPMAAARRAGSGAAPGRQ